MIPLQKKTKINETIKSILDLDYALRAVVAGGVDGCVDASKIVCAKGHLDVNLHYCIETFTCECHSLDLIHSDGVGLSCE